MFVWISIELSIFLRGNTFNGDGWLRRYIIMTKWIGICVWPAIIDLQRASFSARANACDGFTLPSVPARSLPNAFPAAIPIRQKKTMAKPLQDRRVSGIILRVWRVNFRQADT